MIKSSYVKDLGSVESGSNSPYSPFDGDDDRKGLLAGALIPPESIKEESDPYLKERVERLYWLDALRVFAGMMVVFFSSTGPDLMVKAPEFKSYNWNVLFLYNSLPKACVPLFVMISGVFFMDVEKPLSLRRLYSRYVWRIFRCYVVWSLYYTFFDKFVINYKEKHYHFGYRLIEKTVLKSVLDNGHLWYLNFTLGLYILTPLFRGVAYKYHDIRYIFWLFGGVSSILPTVCDITETFFSTELSMVKDFVKSLQLYSAGGITFYFFMGYLLAYGDNEGKMFKYLSYLVGIMGVAMTTFLRLFSSFTIDHETDLFGEYYSVPVVMAAYGIFVFFKMTLGEWLEGFREESFLKKLILAMSNCTFGIYLIHVTVAHLLIRYAKFNVQTINPILGGPIFSAVIYIISFILIFTFRRIIPFFKYFC